jgi:dihydrodipicolinate synthase/N-acetylneuraminate lyase
LSRVHDTRRFPACVLATVVVPWTEADRLDEGLFRYEIGSLLEAGYSNLYVFGTAGEGYAVSEAQFAQVTTVLVDEMRAGGVEPMVGVISLSLETMLQRIAFARHSLGVRRFQISLPSWGALEGAEVRMCT